MEQDALARARLGAHLSTVLPDIMAEVDGLERTLKHRLYQKVGEGTLTEQMAFAAVLEMYSYERLKQRLRGLVAAGSSVKVVDNPGVPTQILPDTPV